MTTEPSSLTESTVSRVLLVEDDVAFQQAVQASLAAAADLRLEAVCASRAEAIAWLTTDQPDILLVDLGLPDGSGIDVIAYAHAHCPNTNIMVCTTFGDEAHVFGALQAGARGYLLKDNDSDTILEELRSLQRGGSPINPFVARRILRQFMDTPVPATPKARPRLLSPREQEVLELITKGFTTDEIAGLLTVSRHTVLTFVRRVYGKLNVTSKTEAVYEARNLGLLDD